MIIIVKSMNKKTLKSNKVLKMTLKKNKKSKTYMKMMNTMQKQTIKRIIMFKRMIKTKNINGMIRNMKKMIFNKIMIMKIMINIQIKTLILITIKVVLPAVMDLSEIIKLAERIIAKEFKLNILKVLALL